MKRLREVVIAIAVTLPLALTLSVIADSLPNRTQPAPTSAQLHNRTAVDDWTWTHEWFASSGFLPNQNCPPWTEFNAPGPIEPLLLVDTLRIETASGDPYLYYQLDHDTITIPEILAMEFRLRRTGPDVYISPGRPADVSFYTAPYTGNALIIGIDTIYFWADTSGAFGDTAFVDTDDDFHTYRIEVDTTGPISVFWDDSLLVTGVVTLDSVKFTSSPSQLFWGHGIGAGWGITDWLYFRHNAELLPQYSADADGDGTADGCDVDYTVSNLNDDGQGSLRDAMNFCNSHFGYDTIRFSVAGVIDVLTPLPVLQEFTGGCYIDGLSAPGATIYDPTIIIDGSATPPGTPGFEMLGSIDNEFIALEIRNFPDRGIHVRPSAGTGNRISYNRIHDNDSLGIDLGDDGVTPNDPGDPDSGPNLYLNFPVFDSIFETSTSLTADTFMVFGTAEPFSVIELFLAAEFLSDSLIGDSTFDHGPAYQLLGVDTCDAAGSFIVQPVVAPGWSYVTATATDTGRNTSEFALNKRLSADPLRITAYFNDMEILVVGPKTDTTKDTIGIVSGMLVNTYGDLAEYIDDVDFGDGMGPGANKAAAAPDGILDNRVIIRSPQSGDYSITYRYIGDTATTVITGIGIDGHNESRQTYVFTAAGQKVDTTYFHGPELGDMDGNGVIDVFDVVAIVDIAFRGGKPPYPASIADVNCDGIIDVFDVVDIVEVAFRNGPKLSCQ